jgi:hypothetical protein
MRRITPLVPVVGASATGYALVVRGALTLDLGIGRRTRPLGPITLTIAAPPETVFDVIAAPYLGRTPRAMQNKLRVLERGSDMVLAAHYTTAGRLTTTTVETVRFQRPHLVTFRLLRGPVPHVLETFALANSEDGTEFVYEGELGTDLWQLGRWWGDRVAQPWEQTVAESLQSIKAEAERRARPRPRSQARSETSNNGS